jgi:hypothetical protein
VELACWYARAPPPSATTATAARVRQGALRGSIQSAALPRRRGEPGAGVRGGTAPTTASFVAGAGLSLATGRDRRGRARRICPRRLRRGAGRRRNHVPGSRGDGDCRGRSDACQRQGERARPAARSGRSPSRCWKPGSGSARYRCSSSAPPRSCRDASRHRRSRSGTRGCLPSHTPLSGPQRFFAHWPRRSAFFAAATFARGAASAGPRTGQGDGMKTKPRTQAPPPP